jgi:hypothetical protein
MLAKLRKNHVESVEAENESIHKFKITFFSDTGDKAPITISDGITKKPAGRILRAFIFKNAAY